MCVRLMHTRRFWSPGVGERKPRAPDRTVDRRPRLARRRAARRGCRLVEYPGWRNRGHGDFKDIRGVMVHHTGSDNASAASIADGRPDLPGPLSQLHIARDGTVTVVAVGVAWHAGIGMYPWLPTNMGNWHMIGIECANSGTSPTAPHRTELARRTVLRAGSLLRRDQPSAGAELLPARSGTRSTRAARRANGIRAPSTWTSCAATSSRIGAIPNPAPTPRPPVPVGEYADVLLFRGSEGPQVAATAAPAQGRRSTPGIWWSTASTARRPRPRSESFSDAPGA